MSHQKTIAKEETQKGVGLHTGENVKKKYIPTPVNHGFANKQENQ